MMIGKEDLGLGLSLGSSENHHHDHHHPGLPWLQLNLMPSPSQHQTQWSDLLANSAERRGLPKDFEMAPRPMLLLRGIDVNRAPTGERESEEETSSPNSTLSSVSGKRSERDLVAAAGDSPRSGGILVSDDEDGDGSRKKLRLSKDQSAVLEDSFKEHNTLNPKQKQALAKQLNLRPRQVEVWFQNRRARTKLKQTEVDCEYLKRCCETLTDENRRLQKEVAELRALKLSPQFYMHMTPPTTLTMCPSCERVTTSDANNIADIAVPPQHPVDKSYHPQHFTVERRPHRPGFLHGCPSSALACDPTQSAELLSAEERERKRDLSWLLL